MVRLCSLVTDNEGVSISAEDTKADLRGFLGSEEFDTWVDGSRVHRRRSFTGPLPHLRELDGLERRDSLHAEKALAAAERVARRSLEAAGLSTDDVDVLVVSSSTGYAVPTLDLQLAERLGLREEAECLFLGGLGCSGAVRALGLSRRLLANDPSRKNALVVAVEVASVWLPRGELSREDVLSSIVFGDGAGAAVVGRDCAKNGPHLVAHRSVRWPGSLEARGARLTGEGWRHVVSPTLGRTVRSNLRKTLAQFLSEQGLEEGDVALWAVNPSDPRLLEVLLALLPVPEGFGQAAWSVWENRGNTLSAGPLYVFRSCLDRMEPKDGDAGLLLVLGPGITCDMLLFRWSGGLAGH